MSKQEFKEQHKQKAKFTWYIGVMPVPPASMPVCCVVCVLCGCLLSGGRRAANGAVALVRAASVLRGLNEAIFGMSPIVVGAATAIALTHITNTWLPSLNSLPA